MASSMGNSARHRGNAVRLSNVHSFVISDCITPGGEIEGATSLTCRWHDQGWGNRKGMVFARTAGGAWHPLARSVAPHATARLTVELPPSLRGRRVQFGYRVGGGGGHSLSIEGAVVQLDTGAESPPASRTEQSAPRPVSTPQDIRAGGFRGFGRRSEDLADSFIPKALVGRYEVRTVYNGKDDLVISKERFLWKGAHVAPRDVLLTYTESGGVRLRFTVFCPNQSTDWLRVNGRPRVGVIESFDLLFEPGTKTKLGLYSTFRGDFRRQGEGILPTKGSRKESLNERVARMPQLVRSVSSDPEASCPICLDAWDADGLVQTQTECGHSFCARCVVSVCNMTPPNTSGTCPLCRQTVSLAGLRRVRRAAEVS
jgi:hypothetical protein